MQIQAYSPLDLEQINHWLELREWPQFEAHVLPKTGFIIKDTAVGFLYKTDSSFCLMEWLVTNPLKSSEERDKALNQVIEALVQNAKDSGFKLIFSSLSDQGLVKRYTNSGFIVTDNNMTNLIRGI